MKQVLQIDAPHEDGNKVLPLIRRFCDALAAEEVAYCHWKSNDMLDRSGSGDNDLDLLISRKDGQRFAEISARFGLKLVKVSADSQMPGVLNYFGYDAAMDKLFHVHVHYQLIVGHDRTKNYRIPIEEPYLNSAVQGALFKIPAPEYEYVVFVIRMVLKHSTWDTILTGEGMLNNAEREELNYLQARIDPKYVHEILKQYLPNLDVELFTQCIQALDVDSSVWTRMKTGQRLQVQLQANGRYPLPIDTFFKLQRRLSLAISRRISRSQPKSRLASGGAMIALVGGDGAGKSTAISELYAWLSPDFDICRIHLGKPSWSWTTYTIRGLLKVGRTLGALFSGKPSTATNRNATADGIPKYSRLLWEVCAARDRYRTYVRARRYATNGGLVICDRFPLQQITLMDGPQLGRMVTDSHPNRFIRFLTRLEASYYPAIRPPEALFVLRVNPEIAVQRKIDEEPASVRVRSQEIWELDWAHSSAQVVDASQPAGRVHSELKSLVWANL